MTPDQFKEFVRLNKQITFVVSSDKQKISYADYKRWDGEWTRLSPFRGELLPDNYSPVEWDSMVKLVENIK